jgi:hypothetical protein
MHVRREVDEGQGPAQLSAALICCTVVVTRLLMVETDSALSLDDGRLLTTIWNATVTTQPAGGAALLDAPADPVPGRPSGRMAKPEGSSGMADGSSPLITTFAAGRSIGEYTTSDPDASVQLSCRISLLFWLEFRPCGDNHTVRPYPSDEEQIVQARIDWLLTYSKQGDTVAGIGADGDARHLLNLIAVRQDVPLWQQWRATQTTPHHQRVE